MANRLPEARARPDKVWLDRGKEVPGSDAHSLQRLENEMRSRNLNELEKDVYRKAFLQAQQCFKSRLSASDFESLAILGKGAFGEVRLVREASTRNIYGT